MNSHEEEERQCVELAIRCARSGDATHWPTAAGWLLQEIERLRVIESELLGKLEDRAARIESLVRVIEVMDRELNQTHPGAAPPPVGWRY